jgi:hypothetical protein
VVPPTEAATNQMETLMQQQTSTTEPSAKPHFESRDGTLIITTETGDRSTIRGRMITPEHRRLEVIEYVNLHLAEALDATGSEISPRS